MSRGHWAALALVAVLAACDSRPPDTPVTPKEDNNEPALSGNVSAISFQQVAETFALGSKHTDLQRDLLKKELIGSIVEWRLKVYEIESTDGAYKITSQPYPIQSPDAVNLIRAVAFVRPQDSADQEVIRKAVTDDEITVRGHVQGITLRSIVTLSPAILVRRP